MPEIRQKLGFTAGQAITNLKKLSDALNLANTSMRKLKTTSDSFSASSGLHAAASQAVTSVNKLNTAANGTVTASKKVAKSQQQMAKGTGQVTASWKTMARVIQTQVLVRAFSTLTRAMTTSIKEAVEFRLRIAEIQSIARETIGDNDALSESVLRLSTLLGKSAEDVAEGLYQVLSNQVVDASEAVGLLEKAEKLAIVTHSNTADAVNALSSVMNSYGMAAHEADKISSTLFKTVELGRLRLADVANILGRVTPLTAKMGVEWEEAAAAIAVMTRQGVKADTAVTQLRAVMQKIIKPTEDMKELFRSWGVKDGPAAIKAFGGLKGVLAKMSKETGGSSSEMAEYFRRVRAIVGVMGIMQEDGKLLADTLEEITNSTQAAKEAWDAYSETNAHNLTVAWNELKVAGIQFGEAVMPMLTVVAEATRDFVSNTANGFTVLKWAWDDTAKVADINARRMLITNQKLAEKVVESLEHQSKAYKANEEAARRAVASTQQSWNKLADTAESAGKRVQAVFKDFAENVVDSYGDAFKGLEKFVNDAKGVAKTVADDLASIDAKASERQFNERVANARNSYQKEQVYASEYYSQLRDVASDTQKGIRTEEQKSAALAKIERARSLAQSAAQSAQASGHFAKVRNWKSQERALDEQARKVIKQYGSLATKDVDTAREKLVILQEQKKQLEELTKELVAQQKLAATSKNAEVRDTAEGRTQEIFDEIQNLQFSGADQKFLDGLNIEHTMAEVNRQMSEGLFLQIRKVEIDLADIQAQFDANPFIIQVRAGEAAGIAKAGEALGVPEPTGKFASEAEHSLKVFEASKKILAETQELQLKKEAATTREAVAAQNLASVLEAANASRLSMSNITPKDIGNTLTLAATWAKLSQGQAAAQKVVDAAISKRLAKQHQEQGGYFKLVDMAKKLGQAISNNEAVDASSIQALQTRIDMLTLEDSQRTLLTEAAKQLNLQLVQNQAKQQAMDELTTKHREEAQRVVNEYGKMGSVQRGIQDSQQRTTSSIQQSSTEMSNLQTNATNAKTSMQGMETALGNTGSLARDTSQGVASVTVAAGSAVGGVNNLTAALSAAKQEALALARAVAASGGGGGGFAYFGGPSSYFAAGGPARGQDTIPAMLSQGETVVSAKNSRRFFSELNAMNIGSQPVYREQGGSVTNVGDVNVTVNGGDSSQSTVREIGQALRREIQRGNIKLR